MSHTPPKAVPGTVGHILKDTLGYLPSAIVPALFSLISTAVFTRIFPPSQYGVYTLLGAITGPALSLSAQPAAQAVQRFLAEYDHRGLMAPYRQAVSWLTFATLIVMLCVSIVALVLWPAAQSPSVTELALAGALAGLWASILYNILMPALMASIQVRAFRELTIWAQGLSLVFPLLLLYFFGHHIAWIMWGNAAGVAAVLPFLVRKAQVLERPRVLSEHTRETLRRFWAYGAPMTFWFFASSMLNVGDRYVIQAYHGTAQVGLYGANYQLAAQGVALLTNPLLNATGPRLLRQWAAGDKTGVRHTMRQMTMLYALLGAGLIGLVAVSGVSLVDILLAHGFHRGAAVLVPVMAGVVVWGASRIGHKSMEFVEKNALMVWDVLFAAAVNMGLNLWLVPRYGFVAAGYTTLVSYIAYTVLVWFQARHLVPWDLPWRDLGVYAGAALVGWAVTWFVILAPHAAAWPHLLTLFTSAFLFVAVYGGLSALWLRGRSKDLMTLLSKGDGGA